MKKIYIREIRHIIANHTIKNKSTAYCFKSKSIIFFVIRKLIKHNLIECKNIDGPFLFVRPTEKLINIFGAVEINDTTPTIQASYVFSNRNTLTQNSHFNLAEISAT